ncbi:hypothetical protein R1flu_001161 [Riccia fluitans]|uniref:Uncharacterized protein n=1 Tax=Riccia fluitans TaxID=41844 RepID=A0ABD1Y2U7_9MARC
MWNWNRFGLPDSCRLNTPFGRCSEPITSAGSQPGLALKPGVVQQFTHSAQKKLTELTSHFQKQPLVTEAEKIDAPVVVQSSSSLPDGLVVTKNWKKILHRWQREMVQITLPRPQLLVHKPSIQLLQKKTFWKIFATRIKFCARCSDTRNLSRISWKKTPPFITCLRRGLNFR